MFVARPTVAAPVVPHSVASLSIAPFIVLIIGVAVMASADCRDLFGIDRRTSILVRAEYCRSLAHQTRPMPFDDRIVPYVRGPWRRGSKRAQLASGTSPVDKPVTSREVQTPRRPSVETLSPT